MPPNYIYLSRCTAALERLCDLLWALKPDQIHDLADKIEAVPEGARYKLQVVTDEEDEVGSIKTKIESGLREWFEWFRSEASRGAVLAFAQTA